MQRVLNSLFFACVLALAAFHPAVICEDIEPEVVIGLGWLQEAKLSPDGAFMATCSDSALHIWRTGGEQVGVFMCPDGVFFLGCEWSPDGSRVAIADVMGRITLVEIPGMVFDKRIEREDMGPIMGGDCWSWRETPWGFDPYPLVWSPNSTILAHGWCNEMVQLYDPENGTLIRALKPEEPEGNSEYLAWTQDSGQLLLAGWRFVRLIDAGTGESSLSLPSRGRTSALSPDDHLIAVVNGTTINLYSLENGTVTHSFEASSEPSCMVWSVDGSRLFIGTEDGTILSWSPWKGETSSVSAHSSRVLSVSMYSSVLASASADQTTKTWIVDGGSISILHTFTGWGPGIISLYWSQDDKLVATHRGCFYPVRQYGPDGSEVFKIGSQPQCEEYRWAVPSPDGLMIATIQQEYEVSLWDGVFGTLSTRLETTHRGHSAEWCPTNPHVLALAGMGGVEVLDVNSGEIISRMGGFTDEDVDETYGLDWSPDGSMLSIGFLSRVEVWDPWKSTLLASQPSWSFVGAPIWSPDGSKIAVVSTFDPPRDEYGDMDMSCFELWQISKLTILDVLKTVDGLSLSVIDEVPLPSSGRRRVDWSPSSAVVAIGIGSQEYEMGMGDQLMDCFGVARSGIMLWELDQYGMRSILNLTGPSRGVSALDWSRDGSRIAAGSNDGTIWVWPIPPEAVNEVGGKGPFFLPLAIFLRKKVFRWMV